MQIKSLLKPVPTSFPDENLSKLEASFFYTRANINPHIANSKYRDFTYNYHYFIKYMSKYTLKNLEISLYFINKRPINAQTAIFLEKTVKKGLIPEKNLHEFRIEEENSSFFPLNSPNFHQSSSSFLNSLNFVNSSKNTTNTSNSTKISEGFQIVFQKKKMLETHTEKVDILSNVSKIENSSFNYKEKSLGEKNCLIQSKFPLILPLNFEKT